MYRATVDVYAWLSIKENLQKNFSSLVIPENPNEVIKYRKEFKRGGAPSYTPRADTVLLKITTGWPVEKDFCFELHPEKPYANYPLAQHYVRIYHVKTESKVLPLNDYYVVFYLGSPPERPDSLSIVGEDTSTPRWIPVVAENNQAFKRLTQSSLRGLNPPFKDKELDSINRSKRWAEVELRLEKYGFTGKPEALSKTEPALVNLRKETDIWEDSSGVNMYGVKLSLGKFFLTAGIFLAAVSFAMLGPVRQFQSAVDKSHSLPWVFIIPRSKSNFGRMLEWLILAISILWALLPLIILALQLTVYPLMIGAGKWVFFIGVPGLIFSTIIFCVAARELRKTRVWST